MNKSVVFAVAYLVLVLFILSSCKASENNALFETKEPLDSALEELSETPPFIKAPDANSEDSAYEAKAKPEESAHEAEVKPEEKHDAKADEESLPKVTFENIFDYNGLIDIFELDQSFVIDCRYATTNNFTGVQQYDFPLALVQKDVAVMLIKAQNIALTDGYRIRIYDSYRPFSVQQSLYDATPTELSAFVAKPSKNEKHSMGLAIDCGLSDMDGNEIEMPSGFDEFNESAYIDYRGGSESQQKNRDYLINLMQSCGFTVYNKEWWHYNAPNPNGLDVMDISFGEFVEMREEYYLSRQQ